jgi:hypothetical protein
MYQQFVIVVVVVAAAAFIAVYIYTALDSLMS